MGDNCVSEKRMAAIVGCDQQCQISGSAGTEPCETAGVADACVSEAEMVIVAAQAAHELPHSGAILR